MLTKGPWQRRSIPGHLFELSNADGEIVLRIRGGMMPTLEDAQLLESAPLLLEALRATLIPLTRLGDFIGNEDAGGISGLGAFDRCAIIGQARSAIARAGGAVHPVEWTCTSCASTAVARCGFQHGPQTYRCTDCGAEWPA